MKNCYILRGLPGAGKSTLANILIEFYSILHLPIHYCSADDYFLDKDGNYNFDPVYLGKAHEFCRDKFNEAIAKGYNVIVDNTNILKNHFLPYKLAAEQNGYNVHIYTVGLFGTDAAFEAHTRGTHNVPLSTVERMARQFEIR